MPHQSIRAAALDWWRHDLTQAEKQALVDAHKPEWSLVMVERSTSTIERIYRAWTPALPPEHTVTITKREAEIARLALAELAARQTDSRDRPAEISRTQRDTLPDLELTEIIELIVRLP